MEEGEKARGVKEGGRSVIPKDLFFRSLSENILSDIMDDTIAKLK